MAFDDFSAHGAKTAARGSVAPEDEDLFDFPVVELTLEHASGAPVPASAPSAPAPVASATPAAPALPAAAHATKPGPATRPATPAAKTGEVQRAAALIEGLEQVLDDDLETSRLARGGRSALGRFAKAGSPLALVAGMLLLNLLTFAFFWYTSRSFRDGLQGLREELVLATRSSGLARGAQPVQAAPDAHPPAARSVAGAQADPDPHAATGGSAAQPAATTPHPLVAFERTTLDLARQEIQAGEMIAARKRLHRLLALADRMDPELQADVEARARFLIAESYTAQAETKERRQADPDAAAPARGDRRAPAPSDHGKEP